MIDATLPLVSIGLGVVVFEEHVRTTGSGLAGAGLGLLLVTGIVALSTSPVVEEEHRREAEEARSAAAPADGTSPADGTAPGDVPTDDQVAAG